MKALARTHFLFLRLSLFIVLFVLLSGIIGPWVISTKLLYSFGFYIYGGLGKAALFGAIAFLIQTKGSLFTLKRVEYAKKNILYIATSFALIPLFFFIGNQLLTYENFHSNIALSLFAHLLIITMTLLLIVGSFGLNLLKKVAQKYYKALIVSGILSLGVYALFNVIFSFWPLLSTIVLHTVQWMLTLTFPPAFQIDQLTLQVRNFSVTIEQTCSGIESLFLFSILYTLIVLNDRKRLSIKKSIIAFVPALLGLFLVNILRVYLIIVAGILVSPEIAVQLFHTYLGMILFILYFIGFWLVFYKRLKK